MLFRLALYKASNCLSILKPLMIAVTALSIFHGLQRQSLDVHQYAQIIIFYIYQFLLLPKNPASLPSSKAQMFLSALTPA
jgi:hypothetical protein